MPARFAASFRFFRRSTPQYAQDYITRFGFDPKLAPLYAMTRHKLPVFNLDSWDGYPAEREQVYDLFEESGANVLVLSGDSHMAWINEPHRGGKRIGLELSATTLTGPAFAELLLPPGDFGQAFADASDDVLWCDPKAVGFVAVTLTRQAVSAEFIRVLNPREPIGRLRDRVAAAGAWRFVWQDGRELLFNGFALDREYDAARVLDGDLDGFVRAELHRRAAA